MISCRHARRVIVDCVREQSDEAERLLLEEHLRSCLGCREERGRFALLEQLRDGTPPSLGPEARARVLDRLTAPPIPATPFVRLLHPARPFWVGFAVAATAGLLIVGGSRYLRTDGQPLPDRAALGPTPKLAPATSTAAGEETLIRAEAAGTSSLPGVHVVYARGTTLRLRPSRREIDLLQGEVDVDVTPGGPGELRVVAPRFVVVVLGTHFVVRPDFVHTLHGRVRVESLSGQVLAVLGAGESWTLAPPPAGQGEVAAPRPGVAATDAPPAMTPKRAAVRTALRPPSLEPAPEPAPSAPPSSSAQLLAEARSFLVSDDTARARERIAAALAAKPTLRERARAELMTADAFLVERQRTQALAAYRRTGELFASLPEGESAAFMTTQLLSEQGARVEARAAFESYLSRHPNGRFANEARDRLAALSGP